MYMKELRQRAMYSQRIRHNALNSISADIAVWTAKTKHQLRQEYDSYPPDDSLGQSYLLLRRTYVGSLKRIHIRIANVDVTEDINPLEWNVAPIFSAHKYRVFIQEVDYLMATLKIIHEFGYFRADKVHYHDMKIVELTNSTEYIYM